MCGISFGRLRNHGAVNVANGPASGTHPPRSLDQQDHRVGALEGGISVREMAADVHRRQPPPAGVGDGVQQHVSIRMAQQAQTKRYRHATEHQGTTGHQRVHIPAFTDTQAHTLVFLWVSGSNRASASAKSSG